MKLSSEKENWSKIDLLILMNISIAMIGVLNTKKN